MKIKHRSVEKFLSDNRIDPGNMQCRGENPYGPLSTNEIILKKDCGAKAGETIEIEVFERTSATFRDQKCNFIYEVEKYDDIAVKLVLKNIQTTTRITELNENFFRD